MWVKYFLLPKPVQCICIKTFIQWALAESVLSKSRSLLFYFTVYLQCIERSTSVLPLGPSASRAPSKDNGRSSLRSHKTTSNRSAVALPACIPFAHAQYKQNGRLRTSRTRTQSPNPQTQPEIPTLSAQKAHRTPSTKNQYSVQSL
jgi:hypothetical protein